MLRRNCAQAAVALVYKVFEMAVQYNRIQRCRPDRGYSFKTLEGRTRVVPSQNCPIT